MSFLNRIITTSIIFFLVFFIGACQASDSGINNILNSERELKTIKIAVGEWDPFVSKNSEEYGETSEIVTAILEAMGYQPEYNFMAWGEAEEIVRENQQDESLRITFPYRVSEKREKEFLISGCDHELRTLRDSCKDKQPILETEMGFFYNAKKKNIKPIPSISELKKISKSEKFKVGYIGQEYGYQYIPEIQDIIDQAKLLKADVKATSVYHSFQNLINGDVQIVPEYIEVAEQLLHDDFPENKDDIKLVEIEKEYPFKLKLHLMVSRKNPHNSEFIKEFNKTHAKLIENKTIEKIENRSQLRPSYKNPGVVLDRCESSYEIVGSDNDGNTYQIPRGTRGLLKDWNFKSKQPKDIETKATILILTDPYRGKQLTIDRKCLILD